MAAKKKKKVKPVRKPATKKATKKVTKKKATREPAVKAVETPPKKPTPTIAFGIPPKLDGRFQALHEYINDGKGTFAETAAVIMEAGIDALEAGFNVEPIELVVSDGDGESEPSLESDGELEPVSDGMELSELCEDEGFADAYEERLRGIA